MKIKQFCGFVLLTVFVLSACQKTETQTIATIDGQALTVEQFIEENSQNPQLRAQLIQEIIAKVAIDKYGKDVKEKEIAQVYEETKKNNGADFDQILAQEGYTEASLKERIKGELALNEAVKVTIKISQADRQQAWKTYHPEVSAQIAVFPSEEQAKQALAASNDQSDLGAYVQENAMLIEGADAKGILSFDSESEALPESIKEATFTLKKGERSEVLTGIVKEGQKNQAYYYIVQMMEPADENVVLEDYQKELDKLITDRKIKDEVIRAEAVQKLLAQADVKIVDEDFSGLLDNYHLEKQQPKSWWENITSLWK